MAQTSKSDKIEYLLDDDQVRGIAHNGIEVTIDRNRCNYSMYDPTGCRKCLQICPVKVFSTRPEQKRDFTVPPAERLDPTRWVLIPTWADWCNGCGACVENCPKEAITIQFGDRLIV